MNWTRLLGPGEPAEVQARFDRWMDTLPEELRNEHSFRIDRLCSRGYVRLRVMVLDGVLPASILESASSDYDG